MAFARPGGCHGFPARESDESFVRWLSDWGRQVSWLYCNFKRSSDERSPIASGSCKRSLSERQRDFRLYRQQSCGGRISSLLNDRSSVSRRRRRPMLAGMLESMFHEMVRVRNVGARRKSSTGMRVSEFEVSSTVDNVC